MKHEKSLNRALKINSIHLSEEELEKRVRGVEEAISIYSDEESIRELVCIYVSGKQFGNIEKFSNVFYNNDKTFDEDNIIELQILAGATLVELIDRNKSEIVVLLIKVFSEYYQDIKYDIINDVNMKYEELTGEGALLDDYEVVNIRADFEEALCEDDEFTPTAARELVNIVSTLREMISQMGDTINMLISEVNYVNEKSDVLSWSIGEYSNILKKSVVQIERSQAAFALAYDLAELVNSPGPFAAEGLLHKMISQSNGESQEISLVEMVDNQEREIRERIITQYKQLYSVEMLPFLSAVEASLSVADKGEWIPIYKKKFGINPEEIIFEEKQWSFLLYLEFMISKC